MITLILCYIFSDTLNWGATVVDVIKWFNNHPFLTLIIIGELGTFTTKIKIKK
jgi:hypothetical protein